MVTSKRTRTAGRQHYDTVDEDTKALCQALSVVVCSCSPGFIKRTTEIASEDLFGESDDDSSLQKLHRCSAKAKIKVGRLVDTRVGCQYCGQKTVSEGNKETYQGVGVGGFGCIARNMMMFRGNKSKTRQQR